MKQLDIHINDIFGKLTIIDKSGVSKHGRKLYKCLCECGNIKIIAGSYLKSGTQSCGCLRKNQLTKHNLYYHPLYNVWTGMKLRCYQKNHLRFNDWGGRGIIVCDAWKNDFKVFYDWAIANEWKENLQIDRINNDGNYEPTNCRFITPRQNSINRRSNLNRNLPVGVYKCGEKFQAKCRINNKSIYLGMFNTSKEAHCAYLNALKEIEKVPHEDTRS